MRKKVKKGGKNMKKNLKSERKERDFMYLVNIGEKISEKVRNGWIKSMKIQNDIGKITLKVSVMA